MMRTPLLSVAFAIATACLPAVAIAQVSIEASPLRVEIQAWPGATATHAVTLSNVGNQRVRVRTSLSDWHLSKDGAPQFEEPVPDRGYAAASWVRFAPPEFVIEPGGQGTVRFTVTVPEGVAAAGYRTGLLFDFTDEGKDAATRAKQVTVRSRIATLVYVHVAERAAGPRPAAGAHPPAAVELTDLRVQTTAEETQVVATLKNTSRRSVRTKGAMTVYDRGGLAIREIPVPDVPVLPESERDVAVPVAAVLPAGAAAPMLPSGDYRVELKIDVGQSAVIVGETTLKVQR
jgi:P pilus assembly chaperone PapD